MLQFLVITCLLCIGFVHGWPWSQPTPAPPAKNGANDPASCQAETFIMAIRRSKGRSGYRAGDNPCGTKCKGNSYCQCKWNMNSCLGTRPDCPVDLTCKPCPKGYQCNGNGFALPPMESLVSSVMNRVDDFMARLRGTRRPESAAAPPA
jgi:hypothetical protein